MFPMFTVAKGCGRTEAVLGQGAFANMLPAHPAG
jgi:hypothetical protein